MISTRPRASLLTLATIGAIVGAVAVAVTLTGCDDGPTGPPPVDGQFADVTAVSVSGGPDNAVFAVTVRSLDTGCDFYADWFEVVDAATQTLLTRRILDHSHVDEQPFTRSSAAIGVTGDQQLVIRAHMNTTGYGGVAFVGSLDAGFAAAAEPPALPAALETHPPQVTGCAF